MTKKPLLLAIALLVALPSANAVAAKKKPKTYKSEEGTIAIAHPVFYSSSGDVVNVTIQEFVHTCAVPATQGLDAYIFEVPAAFQKSAGSASAIGTSTGPGGYDLDVFFYDADCGLLAASQGTGTDEITYLPAGTAWVAVQNYLADPNVSVYIELKV